MVDHDGCFITRQIMVDHEAFLRLCIHAMHFVVFWSDNLAGQASQSVQ
jgi:hypothetical protein